MDTTILATDVRRVEAFGLVGQAIRSPVVFMPTSVSADEPRRAGIMVTGPVEGTGDEVVTVHPLLSIRQPAGAAGMAAAPPVGALNRGCLIACGSSRNA